MHINNDNDTVAVAAAGAVVTKDLSLLRFAEFSQLLPYIFFLALQPSFGIKTLELISFYVSMLFHTWVFLKTFSLIWTFFRIGDHLFATFIDQITCFSFIFITFIFIPILNWHWSTDNPHETILWMNKKNIYENLFSGMQTFIAKTTKKTTLKMDSKTMGKTQILLRPSNSINKNCFMNCSTFISTWTHHV